MTSPKLQFCILAAVLSVQSAAIAQWTEVGPGNKTVTAIAAGPGSAVYAGTSSEGVFRSMDNGTTWKAVEKTPLEESLKIISKLSASGGGDYQPAVWSLAVKGKSLFVAMRLAGVFRSTDQGDTWVLANDGLKSKQEEFVLSPREVVHLIADDFFLFASTMSGSVFVSMDNAGRWVEASHGLPTTKTYYRINALTVLPNNGRSIVFAAIPDWGVYRSTDDGRQWSNISAGLPTKKISAFAAFPGSAGIDHILAGSDSGRVFLSTDGGVRWTALKSGVPEYLKFLSFAVSGENIFAGTNGIVYLSTNKGMSWTSVRTGMPWIGFYSLAVGGGYLYALVTHGRLWRRSIPEMVAEAKAKAR